MNLKNKKGFITIYTMLAMMFFVLFVVVSAITASRKVQIQTETNTELHEIYNNDVSAIVLDEKTIPIYTKAQFLQIINWLGKNEKTREYIYVNDKIYTLDETRYNDNNDEEDDHKFILETDIYLEGMPNTTGIELSTYPYIPNIENFHKNYIENNIRDKIEFNDHIIYVNISGNNEIYEEEYLEIN